MNSLLRFNVYGTLVGVERVGSVWCAFYLDSGGKRRPADFVVPDFVEREELAQYLADLFHESASPRYPDVEPLGPPAE